LIVRRQVASVPEAIEFRGHDPRELTDSLRSHARVVRNTNGQWVILGHEDAVAVARDAERFSSAVSRFIQIPNGLDGEAHRQAREVLDRYFEPDELVPLAPKLQAIARDLADRLDPREPIDAVHHIGAVFAVRAQTAWLGWPAELEDDLIAWMGRNHEASRSGDGQRTADVADEFNQIIMSVLEPRAATNDGPGHVTSSLMNDRIGSRPFTDDELVSILRNWTGGDLGSIALCTGVVCAFLADHQDIQARLATDGVSDAEWDAIIDEILRIDDPFVSNRRRATCPVALGGQDIAEGDVVLIHWTSANRDEVVLGDPDEFDPKGNAANNIVYGMGPHVCPGRPLATMELRILVQELLATWSIHPAGGLEPEREIAPVGGYHRLPVELRRRK